MLTITWQSVLLGALVGVICLLGLAWGLKILLDHAPEEGSDKPIASGKLAFGGVILGAQLFIALGILYFTRRVIGAPLGVAIGLLLTIFFGSFFLKNIRGKKSQ